MRSGTSISGASISGPAATTTGPGCEGWNCYATGSRSSRSGAPGRTPRACPPRWKGSSATTATGSAPRSTKITIRRLASAGPSRDASSRGLDDPEPLTRVPGGWRDPPLVSKGKTRGLAPRRRIRTENQPASQRPRVDVSPRPVPELRLSSAGSALPRRGSQSRAAAPARVRIEPSVDRPLEPAAGGLSISSKSVDRGDPHAGPRTCRPARCASCSAAPSPRTGGAPCPGRRSSGEVTEEGGVVEAESRAARCGPSHGIRRQVVGPFEVPSCGRVLARKRPTMPAVERARPRTGRRGGTRSGRPVHESRASAVPPFEDRKRAA